MPAEPPMSGRSVRTPGTREPTVMMLRDVGSVSIRSRVSTCVLDACCTSTTGAAPETVTDSCSDPTLRSALTVAVKLAGSSRPSRTTVLNPDQREGDAVGARPQVDELVPAPVVGHRGADLLDQHGTRGLDGHTGQHAARFVSDHARDRTLGRCSQRVQHQAHQRTNDRPADQRSIHTFSPPIIHGPYARARASCPTAFSPLDGTGR